MKAARIRLTSVAISKLLLLPEGAGVVSAFQDADDMASATFSLVIRGAGVDVAEGCSIPVLSLNELTELEAM